MCAAASASLAMGCGDDPKPAQETPAVVIEEEVKQCESDAACAGHEGGPYCELSTFKCAPLPKGALIGWGDGSVGEASVKSVYKPATPVLTPDLGFHPLRDELWLIHRQPEVPGMCSFNDPTSARCASLAGFTTTIKAPGKAEQSAQVLEDGNAWHFMRRPPAIAMGEGEMFATCGEAATGNFEDEAANFIGPTLWSAAPSIYAKDSGGNGSHMDMLHASPWCMGIAHESANIYWVFNGQAGSLDRYNFNADHGPGADDHSDGEIYRYMANEFKRVPNVSSHMVYDAANDKVYVADTGNQRVVEVDAKSGTRGGPILVIYEPLKDTAVYSGVQSRDVVGPKVLGQPSGLALADDVLYVGDFATGLIHAYGVDGTSYGSLDSGLGAERLGGVELGPDGLLWFVDASTGEVFKIEVELP